MLGCPKVTWRRAPWRLTLGDNQARVSDMRGESTRSSIAALVLAAVLLFAAVFLGGPVPARAAAPVTLPDLVIHGASRSEDLSVDR
jgi:hypothetical protein